MDEAKKWTIDIFIDEHERQTRAEARLHTRDRTHLVGIGLARRNPVDGPCRRSATSSPWPAP